MSYSIDHIARVCHEANRAHCMEIGDATQASWDTAEEWQRESARKGVELILLHPETSPAAAHDAWARDKLTDGWKFGPVKDPVKKEHPCLVHYDNLPAEQRTKDAIFIAIVNAFHGQV